MRIKYFAFLRLLLVVTLLLGYMAKPRQVAFADSLVCGVPGKDGPVIINSSGNVLNTYYGGLGTASTGSSSINLGDALGSTQPITAGDLLLVIQMQGAEINSTNTGVYGNGVAGDPGSGNLDNANFTAGQYEYVIATNSIGLTGGTLNISSPLVNSYDSQNYPVGAGNQGQRRFQVIRVPQYSSMTLSGSVFALPWNGNVGGVVVLDVAGGINFTGGTINVNGQGFRGGGGVRYRGGVGTSTDYRTISTNAANGSKGEGISGTPRFIFNGATVLDSGVVFEGYPNGSFGRGAPGNAGGGSTDGNPPSNDENSGGGGGGNGGAGGDGGFAWDSVLDSGGFGGVAFPASPTRLIMGGGGGAGTIDDNDPVFSSGGAGGGLVMVRANTVSGNGNIVANGADGQDQILNDSGGGAGAGGSILILSQNGVLPAGLNMSAQGGQGGDAWPGQAPGLVYPGTRHGPGAGGGGGAILLSSTAGSLSVAEGQNGITTTANDSYGSEPGSPGIIDTTVTPSDIQTGISGAGCIPTPNVVKTTSTPVVTQTSSGTSGEYTILVSIPANQGTALGFTVSDDLPSGFTYNSTSSINLSGGALRVSISDPTIGTATPSWGTFNIPGGGQVEITFTVDIDSTVSPGVYQNPATGTYTDPTRTEPGGTTDTFYDHLLDPGEDISVIVPDLIVSKVNDVNGTVAENSSFNWTIAVSNVGSGTATFANGQTIISDTLPGLSSYYPQGVLTIVNGSPSPTGVINCSITGTLLSCLASGAVEFDTSASFSVTFAVTPTSSGELINSVIVDPNDDVVEGNDDNNISEDTVDVLQPGLSILKSETSTGPYGVGDTINYDIVVTNTGSVTLTGVTVVDDSAVIGTCTPAQPSTLTPGESMTCPASHVVTQTDIENGSYENTATGDSNETPPSDSTVTVNFVQDPALSVLKSETSSGPYAVGGTITYNIVVTNLGNITLTDVTVVDNSAVVGTCTPAQPSTLAPGESMTCPASHVVTQTDVDNGSYANTVTGESNETPPSESTVTVTFTLEPALSVVKSETSSGPYTVGDTINYDIVVTNTGNVTLTGVTAADNSAVVGTCSPTQPSTLAPGENMTCPASHIVTQTDVNNGSYENTATGDSNETPPSDSTVTVTLAQNPDISIIKSSDATGANAVGDTITYTYEIENTGDVTLTNVTVTDAHVGLSVIACTPAQGSTLVPGETMTCTATYTVTQADVDAGQIDNTGEVVGTPPAGPNVTDSDPLSESVAQGPELNVVKSETSSGPYFLGDTITYDIDVTNTGNITLTGVTVVDNSADLGTCTPAQPATLAPGDVMACPASHVVTQTDLENESYSNTATADSNETPPGDSTVTVNFGVADLSLVKTVTNTTPNYGSNISFILTVTNIGPEDAAGVEVTDNLPGGFTFISATASRGTYSNATGVWQIGDLALNETVTLNMTVRVNNSGPYTNTAEISASLILDPDSTPNNNEPNEDDLDAVTILPRSGGGGDPNPTPTPAPAPVTGGFLIPVTGFAPNVTTDLSNEPFVAYDNTSITLDIPSLSVDIPIVGVPKQGGTWNVSWLGNQAGWLEGSAFPSWNGNSVLTSHVFLPNGKPGPFAKLYELKTGDQVFVHAFGQKYTFAVLTNATITPTDRSVMRHEEKPYLTLVTCTDYDWETGIYKNRFIVRAVLVKVSPE